MAWPVTVSPLGPQGRRDEAAIEIARALAEISAPSALTDTSRILVVEPRSAQIARSAARGRISWRADRARERSDWRALRRR